MKAWLQSQPREVSVAFAARAALRVIPLVYEALRGGYKDIDVVLPVFRALAFSWVAAKHPARADRTPPPAGDPSAFGVAYAASNSANAAFYAVRVADGGEAIDSVFAFAVAAITDSRGIDGIEFSSSPFALAFWSAVSDDAMQVEGGAAASAVAPSPLWPQPQGQPDQLRSLWQEMEEALLAANENWHVWINWYRDRRDGRVREEESELAFVLVEEALWEQGPAVVNAEINRLVEEIENVPADNPPFGPQSSAAANAILAAWQPDDRGVVQLEASGQIALRGRAGPLNTAVLSTTGVVEPLLPIEAIPEQEPIATRFGVNSQGLIDVVPDPPAHGTAADDLQREYYAETRLKAQALVALGPNQLGELSGPANRFREGLKDRIEDISIISIWSRGNTLRSRLKAHDLSMNSVEPDLARLPPLVAETLRDLVHTLNVFIVGDPKGRELDEIRLGPQDVEAAKQVVAAAGPIIEALQHSENVATPEAIEAVAEQAETAKTALPGVDGDQAIGLARKTTGNFVAELLRRAYAPFRNELGIASKEIRAGVYHKVGEAALVAGAGAVVYYRPAIVSFVARNADALRAYVEANWHNPTLIEIINAIVRNCPGF